MQLTIGSIFMLVKVKRIKFFETRNVSVVQFGLFPDTLVDFVVINIFSKSLTSLRHFINYRRLY